MNAFVAAIVGALIIVPGAALFAQTPAPPPDLDRFVAGAMKEFRVPGLSVAIVKDGKIVLSKGYGIRTLGEPDRVDAKTRFGIASNTKIFTATALGLLVEEGKLEWDAPVVRYLPGFAMYDPYVTRELTIRDLMVHRSGLGLGAGDLLWSPESTYDRKEIVRRLRFIPPATSFRSAYAYDNVLYTVAGEVIEAVSGENWEDFVDRRILARVGMTGSTVRQSDAGKGDNVASTHGEVDGVLRLVPPHGSDNSNPAGGINAGSDDMAKWLMVQLDSGRLADGSKLFQPATTRQLWSMVMPIPGGVPAPELAFQRYSFNGYALGMGVRDYRGRQMLSHSGGLQGYLSKVTMIPELRLGVVVLTNQESGGAFNAISYRIVDHYLGAAPVDYTGIYRKIEDRGRAADAAAERAAVTARDTSSRPSLPLAGYAGTYSDPWYGNVGIALENGKLFIKFAPTPSLAGELVHWQHDTFVARWTDRTLRADAFVSFALNPDATIARAKMQGVSPATYFRVDFRDLTLRPVKAGR